MTQRPVKALRVKDLDQSLRFYCDGLGFASAWTDSAAGVGQVNPKEGLPILLAAQDVTELERWLDPPAAELAPGMRLYLATPEDLHSYRATLLARGLEPGPLQTLAGDGLGLIVTDPDGYIVSFWQPPNLTDAEVVERFSVAPAKLEKALAGLCEADLDLVRAPGKWSIRQTVHHLCDSDASSLARLLMALAEPGRSFLQNPYSQDRWVEGLDHGHRPIDTALALFAAIRSHVAGLVRHLPGALDRSLQTSLGGSVTVRQMLTMLVSHAAGHTAQILETRRVHNR